MERVLNPQIHLLTRITRFPEKGHLSRQICEGDNGEIALSFPFLFFREDESREILSRESESERLAREKKMAASPLLFLLLPSIMPITISTHNARGGIRPTHPLCPAVGPGQEWEIHQLDLVSHMHGMRE